MTIEDGHKQVHGVEKFKGDNYDAWAYRVKTKLQSKDLWKYVEEELKVPLTATDAEIHEHEVKLAQARRHLI